MTYYLVIFFAAFLFSLGLIFLKAPFFSLANSTTSLLNTMLDSSMDEQVKQKALIQRVGKLWAVLGLFLLLIVLVTGISMIPVLIYMRTGSVSDLDMDSFPFYLSMALGGLVLFVLPLKKKKGKENYSDWSVLLHTMVLDNYNISKSLFELDKRVFKTKAINQNEKFVIVSGLARAGTTALTNLLFRTEKFHSLSYANMPFLLATNSWKKVYNPGRNKLKERAHGDRVMFGYKSVEALEEYFFKAFLMDKYITERGLVEHEIDNDTYHNYLTYQSLVKPKDAGTIYLAKNNNLILRYESLRKHNKHFKTVLLFRYPADHAYSLMKQHIRFSELQEKDPFVLTYMNWLGHHEFGLNQKVFAFEKTGAEIEYERDSINYWLTLWIRYYTRILNLPKDENFILVDYDDLLKNPAKLLSALEAALELELPVDEITPFEKSESPESDMDPELEKKAINLYHELVRYKIEICN